MTYFRNLSGGRSPRFIGVQPEVDLLETVEEGHEFKRQRVGSIGQGDGGNAGLLMHGHRIKFTLRHTNDLVLLCHEVQSK